MNGRIFEIHEMETDQSEEYSVMKFLIQAVIKLTYLIVRSVLVSRISQHSAD